MNWLQINFIFLLTAGGIFAQIPRDNSYTVESTVAKVKNKYPDLDITGVMPCSPESVEVTFGLEYKSVSNRSLSANLFSPKAAGNSIGVVMIHGGGWRTGSAELMTPLAEKLAEAGYFVIVPEYRLSLEAAYPAAVEDLKEAIDWMKDNSNEFGFDPDRIAVIGCSSGGQLATLLGTTTPVQAIVDIDGILAFNHPDSQEGEMASQWLGGKFSEVPEIWNEASALSHVSENTPPTLFLASKYPRFLAGHREYMEVLNRTGTYTEIKYLDDAPHSFWLLTPWFNPTSNYIIEFLNKTFKPSHN